MSIPRTQTRVVVTAFNPAEPFSTLAVENDAPMPVPAEGEILVQVTARPINPADIFSIMGVYPGFAPSSLPATPGLEGCGVVADANGCDNVTVGQRGIVFFTKTKDGNGSWQEYVAVPSGAFIPIGPQIPDETAAQFLVNPVTVYGMLDVINAPVGEYILQSAAGSVLGRQLITMAKGRGSKTINLVRRAEQADELIAIGADYVICTETEDIAARVKEITAGKGCYGAVDAVAGDLTQRMTAAVRSGGTLIIYGAMAGIEFKGSVVDTLFRQVSTVGFWLNVWLESLTDQKKSEVFGAIVQMLDAGELVPFSGEKFALKDVVAAVTHSQKPARGGKVLLV